MFTDQSRYQFLLSHLEKKCELLSFSQKLNWFNEVFEIFLILNNPINIFKNLSLVLELSYNFVYELHCKFLDIFRNLFLVSFDPEIKFVGFFMNGNQK